ncbi:hypothetical protein BJ138DRAFT_1017128, partial [Hygrophoropsis aurantiaca]
MLNCFTDLVTYLFRCNTDVTSLLSGTALKAVVAYISDYISKPTLKTYVVFDTIRSIFEKNTSLIGGSLERGEKARKIMTQIVNSLTSKMEIGAPMASLYLLGNPDHYTSHAFVPFYWKSYVSEVRRCFLEEGDDGVEANLVLQRVASSVVGTSPVFDYMYRPSAFEYLSLYDWIRLSDKKRIPAKKKVTDVDISCPKSTAKYSDYHMFFGDHPLSGTHHVRVLHDGESIVPNFVGGSLPRHDKGDFGYYCCTMLTLFSPWRSGRDLKGEDTTWSECFKSYNFTDRQREIMKYFNVRYECLDARDDYSAQMRDGVNNLAGVMPEWVEEGLHNEEDCNQTDTLFPVYDADNILDEQVIGKRTTKWNYDKAVVEQTLQTSGWLDTSLTPVEVDETEPFLPDNHIKVSEWKARVKNRRDEVLEQRSAGMAQSPARRSTTKDNKTMYEKPNEVRLVDHTYLKKSFKPRSSKDCLLINDTVEKFCLNKEQTRAFRIVSNHATLENPDQLKMHLGGMAGTGKSQVIKALTYFFAARNEAHRMISLAPTGTAAALIGGYT